MASKAQGKSMRRPSADVPRKAPPSDTGEEAHLRWGRRNYLILASGGVVIILGFIILALGDKTIAPILLVGGYLGLIPWGILASDKSPATDKHSKVIRGE